VAQEAGELLVLTAEELRRSFEQSPELLWLSLAAIAARTRRIADRETAYREEHKALRDAQLSLLPDLAALQVPGKLHLEALWQPCSYASGDYYDVVPIDSQRWLFAIGDVMGHGAEASLLVAIARAQLRELARGFRRSDELLLRLDGYLRDHAPAEQGMSLAVAVLDLRRSVLEYSSAGHPPALLLRDERAREVDVPPGILLATPFLRGSGYTRHELALEPGDLLLFYTDGLFEVTSGVQEEGELLGRQRLAELFAAAVRERPEAPLAELARRVQAYGGDARAQDDRTALLVALR
jgi:serine phosphatase RsbU (regulator of sigma subunit)